MQLATSFHSARVKEPDQRGYKKLAHAMKYLQAAKALPLALKAGGKGNGLLIGAPHCNHPGMRSHAGPAAMEKKGAIHSPSGAVGNTQSGARAKSYYALRGARGSASPQKKIDK